MESTICTPGTSADQSNGHDLGTRGHQVEFLNRYLRVPVDLLSAPRDGFEVRTNHWWSVDQHGRALFFRKRYPQCNTDEAMMKYTNRIKGHPGTGVVFLPVAYVPGDERPYPMRGGGR